MPGSYPRATKNRISRVGAQESILLKLFLMTLMRVTFGDH